MQIRAMYDHDHHPNLFNCSLAPRHTSGVSFITLPQTEDKQTDRRRLIIPDVKKAIMGKENILALQSNLAAKYHTVLMRNHDIENWHL